MEEILTEWHDLLTNLGSKEFADAYEYALECVRVVDDIKGVLNTSRDIEEIERILNERFEIDKQED